MREGKYEIRSSGLLIYQGESIRINKLESNDKKTQLWIIKDIPLPVRIEYENEGVITIANLKNYN